MLHYNFSSDLFLAIDDLASYLDSNYGSLKKKRKKKYTTIVTVGDPSECHQKDWVNYNASWTRINRNSSYTSRVDSQRVVSDIFSGFHFFFSRCY